MGKNNAPHLGVTAKIARIAAHASRRVGGAGPNLLFYLAHKKAAFLAGPLGRKDNAWRAAKPARKAVRYAS